MERIVLEVDDASKFSAFDRLLKQAAEEAAANGLTEDILQKLLEEDE